MQSSGLLIFWIFSNLVIGLYELYTFYNRERLQLNEETIWSNLAIAKSKTGFLLDAWSEYCKVDGRYIANWGQYVWLFEIANAASSVGLCGFWLIGNYQIARWIICFQLVNCVSYFASLAVEKLRGMEISKYARWWMFVIYYSISSIWIIIPSLLLQKNFDKTSSIS